MLTESIALFCRPKSISGRALKLLPPLLFFLIPGVVLGQQPCSIPPGLANPQTTLTIRADSQQKIKDIYHLRGRVVMTYRDMRLAADRVTYDDSTGQVDARGHIIFDDREGHLEANAAQYNIYTDQGWFSNAHGYVRNLSSKQRGLVSSSAFFVRAGKVERVDQDTYAIQGARLSSCEKENHGLAFAVASAKLEIGRTVSGHEAVFRFLGIPVFYLPFVEVSAARQPRQTGFLLPEIGESTQKGFIFGDGFFWAINPSADLRLGLQEFSARGLGISGRFRAQLSASSKITADFFGINDRASGSLRSIRTPGASFDVAGEDDDLGDGFRGVVNTSYVNSLAFRTIWSENFNAAVSSVAQQMGFATKSFDDYSINFYASRYQDFLSAATANEKSVIIRQAPSVSFSGMDTQLGKSPFYFAFDTSAGGVGRSEPDFTMPTLTERLDLYPRLTLRSRPFWGFRFTPTLGLRDTYYGTSLRPDHSPVNRFLGEFSADLRPPTLERTFSHPLWGHRFKHVIEPDIQYHWVKAADPQDIFDIIRFDTTDILTDDNEIEYSLTNALLERKDVSGNPAKKPQARDLISWTLTQKYFFDPTFGGAITPGSQVAIEPALSLTGFAFPEGRRLSPLDSVLKFSPTSGFDTELKTDLDPQGGGVLDGGITSRIKTHSLDLALTDFFVDRTLLLPAPIAPAIPVALLPSFNLLTMTAFHGDVSHKGLTEGFRIDYNFSQGIMEDFVGQFSYNFGCFGLNGQYERFNLGSIRNENVFRVSVTLGNIGTFGSLKPGQFLQRQLGLIP